MAGEDGGLDVRGVFEAFFYGADPIRRCGKTVCARTSTAEGARIDRDILHAISKDGALGMRDVHEAGARTVAQGVTSCRVFGLPGLAIAQSGVVEVAALREKHVMREGGSPAAQVIESNQGDTP